MVNHQSRVSTATSVRHTIDLLQISLDKFKHGDISQAEALGQFEQAAAMLVGDLRATFLIRLHMLEPLRTPRGTDVPTQAGR